MCKRFQNGQNKILSNLNFWDKIWLFRIVCVFKPNKFGHANHTKKRTNESWGDKAVKLIGNFILFHFHISHQKWCQGFFFFNLKQKNENCLWNYRSLLLGGLVNVKSMICGLTECCPSIWIPPNWTPSEKTLQHKSLQLGIPSFFKRIDWRKKLP